MLQFKKIGAAVAIFLALNAALYKFSWLDERIIPRKGNRLHGFLFRSAVRAGSGGKVLQAAHGGNPLAQAVVLTHPKEFGVRAN